MAVCGGGRLPLRSIASLCVITLPVACEERTDAGAARSLNGGELPLRRSASSAFFYDSMDSHLFSQKPDVGVDDGLHGAQFVVHLEGLELEHDTLQPNRACRERNAQSLLSHPKRLCPSAP